MTNEKNYIKPEEAQEALDSIEKMESAAMGRVMAIPLWIAGMLAILIGTQIALLGAGIRTYNTVLIIMILLMAITAISKNHSAGVMEKIVFTNKTLIIGIAGIIPTYFLTIIAGQYIKATLGFDWAPFAIGGLVAIGFYGAIIWTRNQYLNLSGRN